VARHSLPENSNNIAGEKLPTNLLWRAASKRRRRMATRQIMVERFSVIPARIAAVGEWGTANGERFAYLKFPFVARKKGNPRSLRLKYVRVWASPRNLPGTTLLLSRA
jgi:hypothetical protein